LLTEFARNADIIKVRKLFQLSNNFKL